MHRHSGGVPFEPQDLLDCYEWFGATRRISHAHVRVLLRQVRPRRAADPIHSRARQRADQVPQVWRQGPSATAQRLHVSDIEEILIPSAGTANTAGLEPPPALVASGA